MGDGVAGRVPPFYMLVSRWAQLNAATNVSLPQVRNSLSSFSKNIPEKLQRYDWLGYF